MLRSYFQWHGGLGIYSNWCLPLGMLLLCALLAGKGIPNLSWIWCRAHIFQASFSPLFVPNYCVLHKVVVDPKTQSSTFNYISTMQLLQIIDGTWATFNYDLITYYVLWGLWNLATSKCSLDLISGGKKLFKSYSCRILCIHAFWWCDRCWFGHHVANRSCNGPLFV